MHTRRNLERNSFWGRVSRSCASVNTSRETFADDSKAPRGIRSPVDGRWKRHRRRVKEVLHSHSAQ